MRTVDRLSVLCAIVAAVLLALAAIVVTWSVVYRAMGASTFWEIEFSVYMMVASLFLASPYCLATHGHISVDLLPHYPPAARCARLGFSHHDDGPRGVPILMWRGGILDF